MSIRLERYKGTSYLVTSDNRDTLSDNRRSNVKGYFRTDFPFALWQIVRSH